MKNEYEIRGDIAVIFVNSPKYGRQEVFISADKLDRAKEFNGSWCVVWREKINNFYVSGSNRRINGRRSTTLLHRWLVDAPNEFVVDHINFNTLDNTDGNLRIITQAQNNQNRNGANKVSKSGIRGVFYHERTKKWVACIKVNNKNKNLGYFDSSEEADKTAREARMRYMPYSQELRVNV